MSMESFEWDPVKDWENIRKHGVSFGEAQFAFADPRRLIFEDIDHSRVESRYFCIGHTQRGILTVRFTYRNGRIRIIGAGFWRKGRKIYEQKSEIH